ncbi:MAG: hypothetical protein ABIM03_04075 [candidate division WOR-3 bacterium]
MKVFLNGIYSRSESLIKATIDFERKRIKEEEVIKRYEEDYKNIFQIQEGLEYISDGLLNWDDLLRPFSEIFEGIKVNGLKRYFETNFFYRVLYFEKKIKINENKIEGWIEKYFKIKDNSKRLLILPSPLLFKEFSEEIELNKICDLMTEICDIIISKRKGIFFFEDPVIVRRKIEKEEKNILKNFYKNLYKKGYEIIVQTYFGKVRGILNFLFSLPLRGIGIDFLRNNIDEIKKWDEEKILVAGCIDCENSYIEKKRDLQNFINNLKDIAKEIYLSGNCDFLFLPKKIADEKFNLLKKIK